MILISKADKKASHSEFSSRTQIFFPALERQGTAIVSDLAVGSRTHRGMPIRTLGRRTLGLALVHRLSSDCAWADGRTSAPDRFEACLSKCRD